MERKEYVEGLIMGFSAFTLWGLLPLYWKMVSAITPYQIFAQRVVWSFVFVMIVILVKGNINNFKKILEEPKNWINIIGPVFFISVNWLLYIWAVNSGYVIETSLGYYINPLVLTFLGSIFFKEKLTTLQKLGMTLATIGVVIKTCMYGKFPFIAVVIAVSFAMYGLLKKKSKLDSLNGLAFETLVIGIPALIYLLFIEISGRGVSGNLPMTFWFLISISGIVTAFPLLLYAEGTKRLPLNVVGFLQYVSPTIGLFLGIFVFKENFALEDLIPFALIWIGLIFFTYSQYKILSQR